MTPRTPSTATSRAGRPTDTESDYRPAEPAELRARAWAALAAVDRPTSAAELAELAGITRGAAAAFMTDWVAAGRLAPTACVPGRTTPYHRAYARSDAAVAATAQRRPAVQPESPRLAAALAAAERGWHVLPLRPDNKRPAFPDHDAEHCTGADPRCRDGHTGWQERATTDPDRIRRAWASRPYGIGVACGPSGLLVVDLDRPKPDDTPPPYWQLDGVADGSDVLAVLAERAGQPFPGDTYSVHTGRGGTHLYFVRPAGLRLGNTAGNRGGLGWLIDTRGIGGFVVAAGSTVDGRPYTAICDREPAPLPGWLADRLTPAADRRRPGDPPGPAAVHVGAGRLPAYLRAAVAGELARVRAATEGHRNHTLYVAAVALGQLVAGGALPADLVTAELHQAAAAAGLDPGEIAGTVRSGLRAGARTPRRPTRPGQDAA